MEFFTHVNAATGTYDITVPLFVDQKMWTKYSVSQKIRER
jgi:hypothetical protein